jgi:hypothetical protein
MTYFTRCIFSSLSLLLFLPLLALAENTEKQDVTITELTATSSDTHLIIFGILNNNFTGEMIEVLHSGIPLRFNFYTQIFKTDGSRPDELISEKNFEHQMSFDTLKESYMVTLEENNNRVQSYDSLIEAKNVISEINGPEVVSLDQLIPGNIYKLNVKAKLYEKTLPLSLQSVLPFLSWGNIETQWHTIKFEY